MVANVYYFMLVFNTHNTLKQQSFDNPWFEVCP